MGRERIEHIVVLMMENRSFDHLLGFLDHPHKDYPRFTRPLPTCPVDPSDPDGAVVAVSGDATPALHTDPDHSHRAVMTQVFGDVVSQDPADATMTGFVRSYAEKIAAAGRTDDPGQIMKCFGDSGERVLGRLAKEYAVFVRWFSSVPGETWPNRQFAHAGTSAGTVDIEIGFYRNRTVFQALSEASSDWAVYHDGMAQVLANDWLWTHHPGKIHRIGRLFEDIENDRLAPYVFVEPDHGIGPGAGNSQHPGGPRDGATSFEDGEALIARLHDSLVAAPEVFAKTLLLITYDEHGGFYDRVPPVEVVPPGGQADDGAFRFSMSGLRVPTVAVSPWIAKGSVDDRFFEHTSIPRTVLARFARGARLPSARFDAAADVLEGASWWSPVLRTDVRPLVDPAADDRRLDPFQASLVDLAGAVHRELDASGVRRPGRQDVTVDGATTVEPRADYDDGVVGDDLGGADVYDDVAMVGVMADDVALLAPEPPFVPHPATRAAAAARVLPDYSDAARIVRDVSEWFD